MGTLAKLLVAANKRFSLQSVQFSDKIDLIVHLTPIAKVGALINHH